MEWLHFLAGGTGTAISICIGLLTSLLAERRTRRTRWHHAKEIILRDLARSLADGAMPDGDVILSMIRSTMREQRAGKPHAGALDELMDDLVRQINTDPFLDSRRRRELQAEALKTGDMTRTAHVKRPVATREGPRFSVVSLLVGICSAAAGMLALYVLGPNFPALKSLADDAHSPMVLMSGGVVVLCALAMALFFRGTATPPRRSRGKS